MISTENFKVISVFPQNPPKEIEEYLNKCKEKILHNFDNLQKLAQKLLIENGEHKQFGYIQREEKTVENYVNIIDNIFDSNDYNKSLHYTFNYADRNEFYMSVDWERLTRENDKLLYRMNGLLIKIRHKEKEENYELLNNQLFEVSTMSTCVLEYKFSPKDNIKEIIRELKETDFSEIDKIIKEKE